MIILLNLIDVISKKHVDDMSCQDLYKSKQVIDSEIAKRKALKTKQIDQEYKDIKRMIINKYDKFAELLGTRIMQPFEMEMKSIITRDMFSAAVYRRYDFHQDCGGQYYAERKLVEEIIKQLITANVPTGVFLYLMRESELNQADMNRIDKISKL
jgi:hypothetical protein